PSSNALHFPCRGPDRPRPSALYFHPWPGRPAVRRAFWRSNPFCLRNPQGETLWLRPEGRGLVESTPLVGKGGVLAARNRGLPGEGQSRTFGAGGHGVRRPQNNIITTSTPKSHA